MKKLKWKYIKSRKVWETEGREFPMQIGKGFFEKKKFVLRHGRGDHIQPTGVLGTLKKAKYIAQLLYEG